MDWQNRMKTINQKLQFLYVDGRFNDVKFSVESGCFSASKFVLATGSPVFERMFYGSISFESDESIIVSDVSAKGFGLMLKYLYTDEVEFTNAEEAWQTIECAEKYLIQNLKKKAENYLCSSPFDYESACNTLEKADFYSLEALKECSLKFIGENTMQILTQEGLKSVKTETILLILQKCAFCFLHVEHILEVVVKWAEDKKQELKSEQSVRNFLDPLLPFIRFENLDPEDYSSFIAKHPNIFTENENLSMLMYLVKPGSSIPPSWFSHDDNSKSYHLVRKTEDLNFRHFLKDLKFSMNLYSIQLSLFWIVEKPAKACNCVIEIFVSYIMKRFFNPDRNCWDVVVSCKEPFSQSIICQGETSYNIFFPQKFDFGHQTTEVLIEGMLHFDQPVTLLLLRSFPSSNLGTVEEEKRGNGFGLLKEIFFEQT